MNNRLKYLIIPVVFMAVLGVGCTAKKEPQPAIKIEVNNQDIEDKEKTVDKPKSQLKLEIPKAQDYASYVGAWIQEDRKDTILEKGGTTLRFGIISDSIVTGNISTLTPNAQQIAQIVFDVDNIKENKIEFTFEDDGFGHSGKATIEIIEEKVIAEVQVTRSKDTKAPHGIAPGKFTFVRDENPLSCH